MRRLKEVPSMNGATYTLDSTAEIELARVLGFPRLRLPKVKLKGPTTVRTSKSTRPSPGRFRAETRMRDLNLSGRIMGMPVRVSLNPRRPTIGMVEGRADPNSADPMSPEPIGPLKSTFDVFVRVQTPFGELYNKEPVAMGATIGSIPPDRGRYRQYSPPRDLYDKIFRTIAAQMQCAVHQVRHVTPGPGKKSAPIG
jgi:hypothetical protein